MSYKLANKKIAIVATDGFEESELLEPKKALEAAGAEVDVVSLNPGSIKSWSKKQWGRPIDVDVVLSEASSADYDALMLPGGVINADALRQESNVIDFVSDFTKTGKPIAAICHAAWTLIETGEVANHKMTSWPSLKTDLQNAGASWVDEEVVTDNGWVTSRGPDDLPAFNKKMVEEFCEGQHSGKR